MPNYYNTAAPTSSSKNTINSIVLDYGIRDFLLNKNLAPVYPFLSTSLNGSPRIGEPVLDTMIGTGNITQPFGLPLETEGILRMEIATLPNQFKDQSSTAGNLVSVENIVTAPSFNANWPQGIQSYGASGVYQYGLMGKTIEKEYLKKATIKNLYLDASKQVDGADWITLETAPITQQVKGYMDVYGGLNLGGSGAIQASSVIGSVLNGQGLGLAKGGVVTNFDLRSSLAGRILGATGLINDTKLGMIGGQQLALALANNAAFNVQQSLFGALNVQDNILSLVKNGKLAGFRPNYQITVPSSGLGKVADYTAKILGFTLPKSYLSDAGSIFQSDNISENIARANAMLLNTGKGQLVALIANATANINGTSPSGYDNPTYTNFRSGYAPGYQDHHGVKQINGNQLYAFSKEGNFIDLLGSCDGIIPQMSIDREAMVESSGFGDFASQFLEGYTENNIKTKTFSWGTTEGGMVNTNSEYRPFTGEKKSLLTKTQKLFNSKGMMNIIATKGDMNINTPSQINTAVVGNGISHGNAVLNKASYNAQGIWSSSFNTAEETYCRSWTTSGRYDKVYKLVRHRGVDSMIGSDGIPVYRTDHFDNSQSVLNKYGFPKIAPYTDDRKTDPKKFMFSIENLAWADRTADLLPCEVGPGDLLSGIHGRIMWFPPYNIKFSENNSISWESNQFIGRGESVYTYNNTERAGTLSFSVVVDHPSYINTFRGNNGPDDHYVASFFAGCVDLDPNFTDRLTPDEMSKISTIAEVKPQVKIDENQVPPLLSFDVYFPNDVYVFTKEYENGLQNPTTTPIVYPGDGKGFGIKPTKGQVTSEHIWSDRYNFGLNSAVKGSEGKVIKIVGDSINYSGFSDTLLLAIDKYLSTKCANCVVTVTGFASKQGTELANQTLSKKRATDFIEKNLKGKLFTFLTEPERANKFKAVAGGAIDSDGCIAKNKENTDNHACKIARKVTVAFSYDPTSEPKKKELKPEPVVKPVTKDITRTIKNRFYTECNYFDQLTEEDSFVFDKFRDKIKYFHPAFHSTTPEGLNSRLTFLNQCTRQGPTLEGQGATNLAFGRAPICILRIGDFYNTKIIMESMAIDYDPIVWDLNPEGIGVQPMIANVSISFKFIGGSTLMGPINKLQNALSFNYYANTQVYDARADYISLDPSKDKKDKKGNTIPGYSINLGNPNQAGMLVLDLPEFEISANTPVQDQTKAADNATNGIQEIPPTTEQKEDKDKAINFITTAELTLNPGETTRAEGTVNIKIITDGGYAKDYDAKVFIYDKASKPHEVYAFKIPKEKATNLYQAEVSFRDPSFNFGTTTTTYQLKLEIVGLNTAFSKLTF